MIRLNAKPKPINIIQVYFQTSDCEDEEVLTMYEELQRTLDSVPKQERLMIIGDFNAKIGENTSHRACGMFDLGGN